MYMACHDIMTFVEIGFMYKYVTLGDVRYICMAFDSIDYSTLLHKFDDYGTTGIAQNWFER